MAITELAVLQLKSGRNWSDILPHIRTAAIEQAARSGYPLYFFDNLNQSGQIILLSGWKSVEAHGEWIASETNQKLLEVLNPFLDVSSLIHLTIEPSPVWKDARAMIYTKLDDTNQTNPLIEKLTPIWTGEGTDAESKVEGFFNLLAFNSADVLKDGNGVGVNHVRLVRHDIDE